MYSAECRYCECTLLLGCSTVKSPHYITQNFVSYCKLGFTLNQTLKALLFLDIIWLIRTKWHFQNIRKLSIGVYVPLRITIQTLYLRWYYICESFCYCILFHNAKASCMVPLHRLSDCTCVFVHVHVVYLMGQCM